MNLETEIHSDLWATVRRSYESQMWANSILDATYFLSDVIRNKSGLQSDGTALAGQAFGGKSPKLRLNRLQTESEINVQAGVEQIVRGIYQAIRNPRSHEKVEDTQQSADSVIVFINYLLGVIGHAKSVFSIDDVLTRIQDDNFVPNKRYAELILNEIPKQKRLDTLLMAFDSRNLGDSTKSKEFFQATIKAIDDSERTRFFDVVSIHLRESNDDSELRSVLQILDPSQWVLIGEAERMRSENRLLRSIDSGRYSREKGKCLSGGLATWATLYLPVFTLKSEAFRTLQNMLSRSSKEQQDYVFQYFFDYFDDLSDVPPPSLIRHFRENLRIGDKRYYDAISGLLVWANDAWSEPFKSDLGSFQEADDAAMAEFRDDDIPF
jgi:uncharacterized protein (TIGR02391 family)